MVTQEVLSAGVLSEEHEMLRQAAREFAQNEIVPIAAEFDESGEFPLETIRKMGLMGLMGIEVPEEYGGAGMDTLAYVLALEEICKADAAHGTVMSVNNSLFCYGILKFGTEEQKQHYLKDVASGAKIGAYSLTEPMSGSDAATMRSRAVKQGDYYVINARKSWVTSGPVADYVLLFTMTDADKGAKGISAFLIDADQPGFLARQEGAQAGHPRLGHQRDRPGGLPGARRQPAGRRRRRFQDRHDRAGCRAHRHRFPGPGHRRSRLRSQREIRTGA